MSSSAREKSEQRTVGGFERRAKDITRRIEDLRVMTRRPDQMHGECVVFLVSFIYFTASCRYRDAERHERSF